MIIFWLTKNQDGTLKASDNLMPFRNLHFFLTFVNDGKIVVGGDRKVSKPLQCGALLRVARGITHRIQRISGS